MCFTEIHNLARQTTCHFNTFATHAFSQALFQAIETKSRQTPALEARIPLVAPQLRRWQRRWSQRLCLERGQSKEWLKLQKYLRMYHSPAHPCPPRGAGRNKRVVRVEICGSHKIHMPSSSLYSPLPSPCISISLLRSKRGLFITFTFLMCTSWRG